MPRYRIYRIKGPARENFRWAPHTGGKAVVRARDYELGAEIEAATVYAAWQTLASGEHALFPGDLLESGGTDEIQSLQILKYIGFEPAEWFIPEQKSPVISPNENTNSTNNVVLESESQ